MLGLVVLISSISFELDAYNENLKNVVIPGRYLYVEESMNQWLGHGMPNLKKIPRKPHSIGQEYKTAADINICCIIKIDITGDNSQKKFENIFPKTITTVLRLVEPWFYSGRTVIVDSWFGSPAMVRSVKAYSLYSIMQVKKKRYWPRNMPADGMVQSLGNDYGSVHIMKSLTDSVFIASFQDKKPKCVIANADSNTAGSTVKRWVEGRMYTFTRPLVFEEYGANKGAVDTENNRRDNIPSFHDVMKTYHWGMRCLCFFLAVAEANAFFAHKYVEMEDDMSHFDFCWRLGQSLLGYARIMSDDLTVHEP